MPHWLLECDAWCIEQQPFLQCMRRIINDFDSHGDDGKHMIGILDKGCQHASVLKATYYEDVDCSILTYNANLQVPGSTDCCGTD